MCGKHLLCARQMLRCQVTTALPGAPQTTPDVELSCGAFTQGFFTSLTSSNLAKIDLFL